MRSERALKLAVAEMYVQGVSTRKVTEVMKTLCGFEVTSTQVSRAIAELDAELIVRGVRADGKRTVLGVSVSLSEAEVRWRGFLKSPQDRGLYGVKYIVSADHAGLKAALRTLWQCCFPKPGVGATAGDRAADENKRVMGNRNKISGYDR